MLKFLTGRLVMVRLIMLAATAMLVAIGIAVIYAADNPLAESASDGIPLVEAWQRQAVYAVVGLVALVAVNVVSYRRFGPLSYWIYAAILAMLVVLLIDKKFDLAFVPVVNNSRRWIRIQIAGMRLFQLQPSELCKIAYILALAWYLRFRSNYRKFFALIGPFALTLLAMVLILLEPDLGTVLLMMPILFAMLFVAGARVKHLLIIILLAAVVSPVLWLCMHDYQRMRISGVLLQNDRLFKKVQESPKLARILTGRDSINLKTWQNSGGYHLMHSKYAIASGGLKGFGFRAGPYLKYSDLPERHNDFIFAIIAHQWGFVGCMVVIGLYTVIIACGAEIAWSNTDPFARLIAVGIIAMFAVEVIVNVSMTIGLMPITGLTLPLVSYGGSSLVVSMMAIGLLNNIGRWRPFSVGPKGLENRRVTHSN